MRVLVGCEFSGIVRDAFLRAGHDAYSCDLIETERPGPHYQCDVRDILGLGWDMLIAHPPCQYLSLSGAQWLYNPDKSRNEDRWRNMQAGAELFRDLLNSGIPRIAIENPVMHGHAKQIVGRYFSQVIHPWQFGHGETKRTCLWLRGLPMLEPTNIVEGRHPRCQNEWNGPDRWKRRSRTYTGIAEAMAQQWSHVPVFAQPPLPGAEHSGKAGEAR
jgi:hypothetical protein